MVGVTDDLTGTYNAVELARAGAEALGGKGGGGRPDLAQAGGPDGARAERRSTRSRRCSLAGAEAVAGSAARRAGIA